MTNEEFKNELINRILNLRELFHSQNIREPFMNITLNHEAFDRVSRAYHSRAPYDYAPPITTTEDPFSFSIAGFKFILNNHNPTREPEGAPLTREMPEEGRRVLEQADPSNVGVGRPALTSWWDSTIQYAIGPQHPFPLNSNDDQ